MIVSLIFTLLKPHEYGGAAILELVVRGGAETVVARVIDSVPGNERLVLGHARRAQLCPVQLEKH